MSLEPYNDLRHSIGLLAFTLLLSLQRIYFLLDIDHSWQTFNRQHTFFTGVCLYLRLLACIVARTSLNLWLFIPSSSGKMAGAGPNLKLAQMELVSYCPQLFLCSRPFPTITFCPTYQFKASSFIIRVPFLRSSQVVQWFCTSLLLPLK